MILSTHNTQLVASLFNYARFIHQTSSLMDQKIVDGAMNDFLEENYSIDAADELAEAFLLAADTGNPSRFWAKLAHVRGTGKEKYDMRPMAEAECGSVEEDFADVGTGPGVEVWEVTVDTLRRCNADSHGRFFSHKQYLVIKTNENGEHDLYAWIGAAASLAEVRNTVDRANELIAHLNGVRNYVYMTEGTEVNDFLDLFKEAWILKSDGLSGDEPRLLRVSGSNGCVRICQVPVNAKSLQSEEDVFLLDLGQSTYVFYPMRASPWAQRRVVKLVESLRTARGECRTFFVHGNEKHERCEHDEAFWSYFDGDCDEKEEEPSDEMKSIVFEFVNTPKSLEMVESRGGYCEALHTPDNVFVVDTELSRFIWVGSSASLGITEVLCCVHNYSMNSTRCRSPVFVVEQGKECERFWKACLGEESDGTNDSKQTLAIWGVAPTGKFWLLQKARLMRKLRTRYNKVMTLVGKQKFFRIEKATISAFESFFDYSEATYDFSGSAVVGTQEIVRECVRHCSTTVTIDSGAMDGFTERFLDEFQDFADEIDLSNVDLVRLMKMFPIRLDERTTQYRVWMPLIEQLLPPNIGDAFVEMARDGELDVLLRLWHVGLPKMLRESDTTRSENSSNGDIGE